ncbi:MAG TPA: MrtC family glutamic-type intramembrane protease [Usitatibacter sp.]|nr:MrtC family glutamic-type intramembrane protease [Usitatibacter sp.]
MQDTRPPATARNEALLVSLIVTAVVGLGARLVPKAHVATFVGFVFLFAVWRLLWTKDDARVKEFGLGLGGLLLHQPISPVGVVKSGLRALAVATVCAAVIFGPYYFAWRMWWHPQQHPSLELAPLATLNDVLGQLLLIALPEEAFYRGYLQSRLDEAWPRRVRILGADVGPGLLVASVIFAVGHFVTIPVAPRLAVFFPSLLFGWLRARTRGIGASLTFHAFCNIFSEALGRAYGVY